MNYKTIKINSILIGINYLFIMTLIYIFAFENIKSHMFMDDSTLFFGILLCLQTLVILLIEKRRANPLVVILAFIMTFFYEFRVITFFYFPTSYVFNGQDLAIAALNKTLIIIIFANVFLCLSVFFFKKKKYYLLVKENKSPVIESRFLFLIFISLTVGNIPVTDPGIFLRIIQFLFNNFLSPTNIMIVFLAYLFSVHNAASKMTYFYLVAGVCSIFIVQTLSYSRGSGIAMVEIALCLFLAIVAEGKIRILMLGRVIGVVSLLAMISVFVYQINSFSRENFNRYDNSFYQKTQNFADASRELNLSNYFDLKQVLMRIGYLDFTANLIYEENNVKELFTPSNYYKSIVDNILSPGFDFYDYPFLSNAFKYHTNDIGLVSKMKERGNRYHTDQFGVYGESYLLFGYWFFPIFLIFGILFAKLYFLRSALFLNSLILYRSCLLFTFSFFINSFGFDLVLFKAIVLFTGVFLIEKLVTFRLKLGVRNHVF